MSNVQFPNGQFLGNLYSNLNQKHNGMYIYIPKTCIYPVSPCWPFLKENVLDDYFTGTEVCCSSWAVQACPEAREMLCVRRVHC